MGLPGRTRRAISLAERSNRVAKNAAKSKVAPAATAGKESTAPPKLTVVTKRYVPIIHRHTYQVRKGKKIEERRTITGVVLEPDTVDAQKDSVPSTVILDAAEQFLADINIETTLGIQHKDFDVPLVLVQSWVVPDQDITINSVVVLKGSWVITVRVLSTKIWKKILSGELTGFSIGGKATVQNLPTQAVA